MALSQALPLFSVSQTVPLQYTAHEKVSSLATLLLLFLMSIGK